MPRPPLSTANSRHLLCAVLVAGPRDGATLRFRPHGSDLERTSSKSLSLSPLPHWRTLRHSRLPRTALLFLVSRTLHDALNISDWPALVLDSNDAQGATHGLHGDGIRHTCSPKARVEYSLVPSFARFGQSVFVLNDSVYVSTSIRVWE
jgi:hypothetical protein